jgi:predicted nucleic acid-binding protein
MILCDTGVIIAAILPTDNNHTVALKAFANIKTAAITTWPCLTEAMYILGEQAGSHAQEKLRRQIEIGFYRLPEPTYVHAVRACTLMRQYADAPMDFADASLVVAAETLGITRRLTFDRHFHAYRINGQTTFDVITANRLIP